jgi:allantoate deiminase
MNVIRPGAHRNPAELAGVVLKRCDEIAQFSEDGGKITRTFLSEPMRRVHAKLTEWMEEANLAVRIDSVGNVIGHHPGSSHGSPVLMIGSHVDSVSDTGK